MIENLYATLEVTASAHDDYNESLDEACKNMVWVHPGVTNWYKNKNNRLTITSPWTLLDSGS